MFIKFEYIKFKNFRSFPAIETQFDFEPGLNSILGVNGGGKSTITTEAISYCLYGKPYSKINLSDLLNRTNKKKLFTECAFVIGKDRYVIQRGMKPNLLKVTKNGEDYELLSSTSLIQDEIDKILGIDYKMFKNIISLSVNYNKPFFELSKQDKREILENIFNVNAFGDMMKVLKPKISKLKVDIDIDTNRCNELEESVSKQKDYLDEVTQSQKNFEQTKANDLKDCDSGIEEYRQTIEVAQKSIASFVESIEQEDSASEKKIAELEKKIEDEKNDIQEKIDRELAESEQNEIKYRTCKDNAEQELKSIEGTYTHSKNYITTEIQKKRQENSLEIEKLEKKIANSRKVLEEKQQEIETKINKLGDIDYTNENKKCAELKSNIGKLQTRIDIIREKVRFFETNDVCPECEREIDKESKQEKLSECNSTIEKYEKEIDKLDEEENKYNAIVDNKIKTKQKLDKLKEDTIKYETIVERKVSEIRSSISELQNDSKIKELEKELDSLEKKYANEKSELEKQLEKCNFHLESLNEKTENRIEQIKASSTKRDIEYEIKTIRERTKQKECQSKIGDLKERIEITKKEIEKTENRKREIAKREFDIDIKKINKELKEKQKECNEAIEQKDANLHLYDNYNIVKEILGDNGLKSHFYKKLIPILNQKINQYCNQLDLPVTIVFNEDIDVDISTYNGRNSGLNYNSFSGGERKTIDMSILFAFIDVSKTITNWGCNILVLDEIFDSGLDSNRMEQLVKLIKDMVDKSGNFCVYLISHKAIEHGYFDRTINIKKEGQFSKIV